MKSALVLIAFVLVFFTGIVVGYLRGYYDGINSEFDGRFLVQNSFVQSLIRSDEAFAALTVERFGDGNVLLGGSLPAAKIDLLKKELTHEFGETSARLALQGVKLSAVDKVQDESE